MAVTVRKVTVSIPENDYQWIESTAEKTGRSVSGVLAEAARVLRQRNAADALIAEFGDVVDYTPEEAAELRRQWGFPARREVVKGAERVREQLAQLHAAIEAGDLRVALRLSRALAPERLPRTVRRVRPR